MSVFQFRFHWMGRGSNSKVPVGEVASIGEVASVGPILTRSVSEGTACVEGQPLRTDPSLALRVMKETTSDVLNRLRCQVLAAARLPLGVAILSLATSCLFTPELLADGPYLLRHKLKQGEILQSEVTHLAKTDTRVNGTEQSSQSRTVSRKVWEVQSVDSGGKMTFVYRIDSVSMSQQIGDGEEIRYDSEKDEVAPSIYQKVAETLGEPISTVTIDGRGSVVDRDGAGLQLSLGMGDIAIVFPEKEIAIGESWQVPRDMKVRDEEGEYKEIKIREQYRLEKVSAGVATLSVESIPITPIRDPRLESQIVQQLSNGTIRFDLDAGRLLSKELHWDDNIVDFSGPGSNMVYSARYQESLLPSNAKTANRTSPTDRK